MTPSLKHFLHLKLLKSASESESYKFSFSGLKSNINFKFWPKKTQLLECRDVNSPNSAKQDVPKFTIELIK
jgi:tRNA A37 threonylcarbamoyltransferase TsaD